MLPIPLNTIKVNIDESNDTPGSRFAKSKFLRKTVKPQLSDRFLINSLPCNPPLIDEHIAERMETLRLRIFDVLRLPLPAQKRSRLVRNSCLIKSGELEYLVKEVRLLIDAAAISPVCQAAVLSP